MFGFLYVRKIDMNILIITWHLKYTRYNFKLGFLEFHQKQSSLVFFSLVFSITKERFSTWRNKRYLKLLRRFLLWFSGTTQHKAVSCLNSIFISFTILKTNVFSYLQMNCMEQVKVPRLKRRFDHKKKLFSIHLINQPKMHWYQRLFAFARNIYEYSKIRQFRLSIFFFFYRLVNKNTDRQRFAMSN